MGRKYLDCIYIFFHAKGEPSNTYRPEFAIPNTIQLHAIQIMVPFSIVISDCFQSMNPI